MPHDHRHVHPTSKGMAFTNPQLITGLASVAAPLPLAVRHIEVVQTIQDGANSVGLIADKATVVRVYVNNNAIPFGTPITGELAWSRNGGAESYLPALSMLKLPTQNEALLDQRSNVSKSLNFRLPAEAIGAGQTRIRVNRIFSVTTGNFTLQGSTGPHTCSFKPAAPLRIRAIGLRYKAPDGRVFTPDAVHFAYMRSYLSRAYPVASVSWSQIVVDADFNPPFDENTAILANAQIAAIRSRDVSNGIDFRTHYYGLVSDGGGFMRGRAFAIPGAPRPDVVASGPVGVPKNSFAGDTDLSYADWYGAHELGHTFGRFHPGFPVGKQDQSDPDFPYANGQISSAPHEFVGFDVGDASLALPMMALPGDIHHDFMTYADRQWVSAYTYEAIRARLAAEDILTDPSGGYL